MAKDFFEDIGEMGVLGDILGGMMSGLAGSGLVPQNNPDGKLLTAQSEMFKLKKQEVELLLEVGRQAYEQNPSAFPQDEKLKIIQASMAEAQAEIDKANQEKEQAQQEQQEESPAGDKPRSTPTKEDIDAAYIKAASAFDTPDTRICKKCETRIRDLKMTVCFYCGEPLTADEKPVAKTSSDSGSSSGSGTVKDLLGKYYLLTLGGPKGASEEENQQSVQMLEAMAASTGLNTWELNTLEFIDDTKVNVKHMFVSSIMECTYTIAGDKVDIVDDKGDKVMQLLIDGDLLASGDEESGIVVFSKTPPAEKK